MKYSIYTLLFAVLVTNFSEAQTITTVAGNHTAGYTGNGGPATNAELYEPNQVNVDGAGNIYIAETGNNVIRKVSPAGIINVIAGNYTTGYSGDGGPATAASLSGPSSVCLDAVGNLYIAEIGNACIRRVTTSGIITTIVGNGISSFSGDGGPADSATLGGAFSVRFDGAGNLYIADLYNYRIRKVNTVGIISTIAGSGSDTASGDGGPATAAGMTPIDIAFDKSGNMYISDFENNEIRKVDASGTISTIAGTGINGYSGNNGPATAATLQYPYAICTDTANNIYITDNGNECIGRINTFGIINTIAGNGGAGYSGDGGPAFAAQIHNAGGVMTDTSGNMFIADFGNNVIRKVNGMGWITKVNAVSGIGQNNVTVYPNPATDCLIVNVNDINTDKVSIQITDITGNLLLQKTNMTYKNSLSSSFDIHELPAGVYLVTVKTNTDQYVTKVVKE